LDPVINPVGLAVRDDTSPAVSTTVVQVAPSTGKGVNAVVITEQ